MKNKPKVALITGITGQDGSLLAEFLLNKKYIVHGLRRRVSVFNSQRIDHIYYDPLLNKTNFHLHYGDLLDGNSIIEIINKIKPDEIYNLAAQSHVHISFLQPEYTSNVNALGALRVLDAIKILKLENKTKFYQASTSELFGNVSNKRQNELTPFYPRSPYAVSKLFAYWITINYRESYKIFACNGILFNHESSNRGENFITRKITRGITRIYLGIQDCLFVGNLYSKRDWGHAKDYVEAQWLMLQQKKPKDYVIATGLQFTVKDFINKVCKYLNIDISWQGNGLKETGYMISNNKKKIIIKCDKKYFRPSEVDSLLGDPSKAKKELNWKPKYNIDDLVAEMTDNDLRLAKIELSNKNFIK